MATRYRSITVKNKKTGQESNIPTVPIVEGTTSTAPTAGMSVKSDGKGGLVANELLYEANCIYNDADTTAYVNLSKANSSTTYTIYNFRNKTKVTYKNGTQTSSVAVDTATEKIFVPGILLYDKNTKKMFFVKDLNTIIPVIL